jgi:hypothetical protein
MPMALWVMLVVLVYCYAADRSQLFEKISKQHSVYHFLLLCSIVIAGGFARIRHSGASNNRESQDQPFLSRDQTEEWKGWMQFFILIYHWTGGSQILWIYKIIRVLVASYLFLTGYGHTCFFLKRTNYSFRRVAGVLVRVNLLSCMLPYIMNTNYMFYYFAPLVSFWFLVIYATMGIYASKNDDLPFLISKVLISAAIVSVIIGSDFFPIIFSILEKVFNINWDAREWQFRLALDRYIVYVGMLVGAAYTRLSAPPPSLTELPAPTLGSPGLRIRGRVYGWTSVSQSLAIGTSILALPTSLLYQAFYFDSKKASNAVHPYTSMIPILSFMILRNSNRIFRNHHSVFFAWLGTFSLETFTLQFHIWLAAGTHARLVFGGLRVLSHGFLPKQWAEDTKLNLWIDFIMLTAVFFWLSKYVADATGVLTAAILYDSQTGVLDEEKGFVQTTAARVFCTVSSIVWPEDLRLRFVVILGLLWVLNLLALI